MRGDELYEKVKQLEQSWLQSNVQKLITESISVSLLRTQNSTDAQDQSSERREAGEKFLAALKDAWEDHQLCMGMVTDVMMYMVGGILGIIDSWLLLTSQCRTAW
jgi:cullin 3